jgi:large subunit ribosomal protein L4
VLVEGEENVAFSFRNLPEIHVIAEHQLNVYDVMNADNLIFSRGAVDALQTRLTATKERTPQQEASDS